MRGWVYVITNKAMPDLLKVGFTLKDPNLRARELGSTGLPHPYVVDFEVLVMHPRKIEEKVHAELRKVPPAELKLRRLKLICMYGLIEMGSPGIARLLG
jgi:hypothetical protein